MKKKELSRHVSLGERSDPSNAIIARCVKIETSSGSAIFLSVKYKVRNFAELFFSSRRMEIHPMCFCCSCYFLFLFLL